MKLSAKELELMDEVRAARNSYDITMHACVHWDGEGSGEQGCCHEFADAENWLSKARRELQNYRRRNNI